MYKRLTEIATKEPRLILGLMSGTSHDGVDAALARVGGTGENISVELVGHYERKFPQELRKSISGSFDGSAPLICSLNFELGRFFAETAQDAMGRLGVPVEELDLVGSHGQTVHHIPPSPGKSGSTLQIGEPSIIAGMLGVPVVSDFRTADMAEGGHGAPLTPYADWALFRRAGSTPVIVNIGGICNVTAVSENLEGVMGFDTGPGNSLMDEAALLLSGGKLEYDKDGLWAASGKVNTELLDILRNSPYLSLEPPKSTGRETFGRTMVQRLAGEYPSVRPEDMLCTLAHFTAKTIAGALERFVFGHAKNPGPVALCGGGARNPFLVRLIRDRLAGHEVTDTGSLGVDPDAREALAFAILANEALCGTPASLPRVTGAARPRVLGKICI